jgi:hypothetical protein
VEVPVGKAEMHSSAPPDMSWEAYHWNCSGNPVVQYRAMPPGILGMHGIYGNLESATYRFSETAPASNPISRPT